MSGSIGSFLPGDEILGRRNGRTVRLDLNALIAEAVRQAAGGTVPGSLPAQTPAPTSTTIASNAAEGTLLFTLPAVPAGATRSALTPNDGRFRYRTDSGQTIVEVGSSAMSAANLNITCVTTLSGATGSPATSTMGLTISAPVVAPDPGVERQLAPYPMEGSGAPSGTVQTFALPMRDGDFMAGDALSIRLANGTKLVTQADADSNTWPSGYSRLAVLHVPAPVLASGAMNAATIWREGVAASGSPINMATALSGRTARVEIFNGANTHVHNCITSLASDRWFNGPVCAQTRQAIAPSRAAVGGLTDADMTVDFAVYSDGSVAVDVMAWNRKAWVPNQGDAAFTIRIVGDAGFVRNLVVSRAWMLSGVPFRARWNAQGQEITNDALNFIHNADYVTPTGLIAHYDRQLGVEAGTLENYASRLQSSGWNAPYGGRDITRDMTGTGARPDIGETTLPNAVWMVTGDKRAKQYSCDQAEAAFSIPMFVFDGKYGRWGNPVDRPYGRATYHDGDFVQSSGRAVTMDDGNGNQIPDPAYGGWSIDEAHWPDSFTIPYVMTGRRIYLDGILGMAAFGIMKLGPDGNERGNLADASSGDDTDAGRTARRAKLAEFGEGANFTRGNQVRGQSGLRRALQYAAVLAPPAEQYSNLRTTIVEAHYKRANSRWPALSAAQGPVMAGASEEWVYGSQDGMGAVWQMMMDAQIRIRGAFMKIPGALENAQRICDFLAKLSVNQTGWFGADATQYNLPLTVPNGATQAPLVSGTWTNTYAALKVGINSKGDNYANVVVDTGVDYELRLMTTMTQYRDLCAVFSLPTTYVDASLVAIAAWPRAKTFTDNPSLQHDSRFSVTRMGTTRA